MKHYFDKIDAVTGYSRVASRFARVVGASSTLSSNTPDAVGAFLAKVRANAPKDVPDSASTAVGAAAGAILWKDHRILGLIGGASAGRNLPALLSIGTRRIAAVNLGVTSTAILGSLALPKNPVVGFLGGAVVGGGIAYLAGWRK